MRFRFPRQAKLSRARDFESVLRLGRRLNVFPLRVRALRRESGQSRLGLAIGRRVGGAVVRNRWKRAIRRVFRVHRHRLAAPYDLVVGVSWESGEDDLALTERAFLSVLTALGEEVAGGPPRAGAADKGQEANGAARRVWQVAGRTLAALGRAAGWGIIALLRGYQLLISPLLPRACRFQPSCSRYMIDAVRRKGPVIGVLKGLWRLLRCNPFCRGGYDPVE